MFAQVLDAAVKTAFEADAEPSTAPLQVSSFEAQPSSPLPSAFSAPPLLDPPPDVQHSEPSECPIPNPALAEWPMQIIPARMLNEFVYCPRLFYYEHVEGVFTENADTLRGGTIHKRVDAGSGALRPPDLDPTQQADSTGEVIHSRSVSLGSERLGVTAKLDLVEGSFSGAEPLAAGADDKEGAGLGDSETERKLIPSNAAGGGSLKFSTCPVDYKAGSPREGDDGIELWPTDRMQLGLQMLLLRENGYACERGIIYYRATKQRVPLEMTPALEAWVLDQISAARNIANGPIPPPLVASPKCVRCSLNSICLPDETRMLGRNAEARRGDNGTQVEPQRHRDAENGNSEAGRGDNGTRSAASVAPGARYSPGLPESPCLPSPRRLMAAREDTRLREEEVLRREVIEPFVM